MMDAKKFDENTERIKKFIDTANRHHEYAKKWTARAEFWMGRADFDRAQKCFDRAKDEKIQANMRLRMARILLNRME